MYNSSYWLSIIQEGGFKMSKFSKTRKCISLILMVLLVLNISANTVYASSNYVVYVEEVQGPVSLSLWCNYTTSGNHSGTILQHSVGVAYSYDPSTYFNVTVSPTCSGTITSSGKDIVCSATVTVTYSYYENKIIHTQTYVKYLSGIVAAIR